MYKRQIINTSRGALIDEAALIEALENDKSYRKTVDMPFSDNELKIYNFDTN